MRQRRTVLAALAAMVGFGLLGPAPAGAVAPPPAKSLVVTAAPVSSVWSQSVKLTVAITPKGGGTPKGGTVTFLAGDLSLGTATATARNTTFTTSALPPGEHHITASYGGDAVTAAGTSAPVMVTVTKAATGVSLASSGAVEPGQPATLKATVRALAPASTSRRPTGTVVFTRGTSSARVAVNANGVATWRPSTLPLGSHSITATYEGNELYGPSTSSPVTQEIAEVDPHVITAESTTGELGGYAVYGGTTSWTQLGQTFEVTVPGQLDQVTVAAAAYGAYTTAPLEIAVYRLKGGVPEYFVTSGRIDPTTWTAANGEIDTRTVTLDAPLTVEAGDTYALVARTAPDTVWSLGVVPGDDSYPGTFVSNFTGPWGVEAGHDVWFRAWVIPAEG